MSKKPLNCLWNGWKSKSLEYFKKSCDLGNYEGCKLAAHVFKTNECVADISASNEILERSFNILKEKCFGTENTVERAESCVHLGEQLWWLVKTNQHFPWSQYSVPSLSEEGLQRKSEQAAIKLLVPLCEKGEGKACFLAGYFHREKYLRSAQSESAQLEAQKHLLKSTNFFSRGCELKDSLSCASLGSVFQAKGDNNSAWYFYERACEMSSAECSMLGDLLSENKDFQREKSGLERLEEIGMYYLNSCISTRVDSCTKLNSILKYVNSIKQK